MTDNVHFDGAEDNAEAKALTDAFLQALSEAGMVCMCEHESHDMHNDATHPDHLYQDARADQSVRTLYGVYSMCNGCAEALPAEYRA